MLPEAIIPPSDEHSYAQWLKEQDPENPQPKSQGKRVVFIFMAHAILLFVTFVNFFLMNHRSAECELSVFHGWKTVLILPGKWRCQTECM